MRLFKCYLDEYDDSWWAIVKRKPVLGPTTTGTDIVEVRYMSSGKLYAVHAEGDSVAEVVGKLEGALVELKGKGGAKPETKPEGKPGKAEAKPSSTAKVTLDQVKNGLTKLKTTVDEKEGEEKKAGIKAVKAVLKKFGVSQSPDLTEDQYAPIMEAIEAAMPKEDEDF